jgi:FAD:protein FMN transferase
MLRVEHVMGMPVVVESRDGGIPDEVFDWLHRVDETFSTYKHGSEISRLRCGELDETDASDDVRWVLRRCRELRDETAGYFDIDAVGLDPSGYVKGWAVERAAAILDEAGSSEYAINAGGDIRTRGRWRIGIQHPLESQAVAKVVEADDVAIATSGAYERGEHVRDPHTGAAPAGILSVTVTGPDLGTADAYATAAYAMGSRRAIDWTARLRGYEALTILADGRVLSTPGFPRG